MCSALLILYFILPIGTVPIVLELCLLLSLIREDNKLMCGTDETPLSSPACINDGNTPQHVCGTCAVLFDVYYPIGTYLL